MIKELLWACFSLLFARGFPEVFLCWSDSSTPFRWSRGKAPTERIFSRARLLSLLEIELINCWMFFHLQGWNARWEDEKWFLNYHTKQDFFSLKLKKIGYASDLFWRLFCVEVLAESHEIVIQIPNRNLIMLLLLMKLETAFMQSYTKMFAFPLEVWHLKPSENLCKQVYYYLQSSPEFWVQFELKSSTT